MITHSGSLVSLITVCTVILRSLGSVTPVPLSTRRRNSVEGASQLLVVLVP